MRRRERPHWCQSLHRHVCLLATAVYVVCAGWMVIDVTLPSLHQFLEKALKFQSHGRVHKRKNGTELRLKM